MKGSNPHIYFITGASGVGKTTLVSQLEGKYRNKPGWLFLHFDAMGVPSKDEMKSEYGSEENWQKETTQTWVQKMLTEHQDKTVIIFEGQVNLNFISFTCPFNNTGIDWANKQIRHCRNNINSHHRITNHNQALNLLF